VLEALLEVQTAGQPKDAIEDLVRALVKCLAQSIAQPEMAAGRTKTLLEDVCVYLQSHYQHDVTRESVAQGFRVSPNYLSRVFRAEGDMTFSSYLMHVRVDRAKHLLRSYDFKLDDLAARCGYRDAAYFCRVFKKLAKVTPAEYRQQQQVHFSEGGAPKSLED